MTHQTAPTDFDHSVTRPNTVKHWVLYTLDAIEAEGDEKHDLLDPRKTGVSPERIYDYAAGDDSIVFRNHYEIGTALSEMARMGDSWEDDRPVNRRTEETYWDGPDVEYLYRLTDYGRRVLLDLDVPEMLPNRRDYDEADRSLGVLPAHQPGWWLEEYEHYESEWDIRDHDWIPTDTENVYYKDEGSKSFEGRGYTSIGEKLHDIFPDVTFVLSVGPHRMHDMMYMIRDPWRKVVQIDVYSPMWKFRESEEITQNFEALVHDLRKGLETAGDDDE